MNEFLKDLEIEHKRTRLVYYYISMLFTSHDFKEENDLDRQKKGVDFVLSNKSNCMNVDAKYTDRYNIKTQCFELCQSSNHDYYDNNSKIKRNGWFLKPDSLTTHYLICIENKDKYQCIEFEYILISKEKLNIFLSEYSEKIVSALKTLTSNYDKTRIEINDKITVSKQLNLDNKPINLLINKNILRKFCDFNVRIEHKDKSYSVEVLKDSFNNNINKNDFHYNNRLNAFKNDDYESYNHSSSLKRKLSSF